MADDRFAADMIRDITATGGTQRHIARALNVSEASVSRWANGTRRPCGYVLFRLARLHLAVRGEAA